MKHRSLGIFIILAATLAAIPQASQELSAIRDAVGRRARVELWNTFLALQSGAKGGAPQAAPSVAPAAVASCDKARVSDTGGASKAAADRGDDARREAKTQSRRAGETETAMIIVDPSEGPQVTQLSLDAKAAASAVRRALRLAPAGRAHGVAEVAMFVPPGEGVEIDVDASNPGALSQLGREKKGSWLRREEIAELEKHMAFAETARDRELVRRGEREAERARDDVRRRMHNGAHTKGGVEVKPAEQFLKVFKFKTPEKIGPAAPVAFGGRPGGQIYVPAPLAVGVPAPAAATE